MASSGSDDRRVVVPATAGSVARARRWVLEQARDVDATRDALAATELVTSEVVTNAIRHADGSGTVEIRIRLRAGDLTVEVEDGDPRPPVPQQDRAGLPGGHGLHIVEASTSAWGWRPRRTGGKVVWFTVTW
ncbi:ATP-binding protein [Cellulomonas sp. Marseille-Q8402]